MTVGMSGNGRGGTNPQLPMTGDPALQMLPIATAVLKGHDPTGAPRVILRCATSAGIHLFALSNEHALQLSQQIAEAAQGGGIVIARDVPP